MKHILLISFLITPLLVFSQKLDLKLFENIKPRNIGPAGMAGRVTAIDVYNDNPDIMLIGTASGGLWKSESGGIKWESIFEKENTSSIGAVAIQQDNPSVIWVGTGEGNPRNSLNSGDGIYKSLDGGKNWIKMGLDKTYHIHRIIIHPKEPNIVYAGVIGSPWGNHSERGLFKTTDGGKSWKKILYVNESTGVADLVIDPTNPNKLIATMWEHHRDPWFFKSGGKGSGLHITFDGGENWKKITDEDGLPKGELGRIGVAIAPSEPNIVYALVEAEKNALYKSSDGGFKWVKINDKNDIGNRPFYYSEIYVDPKNENRVYSIFTYVNVSNDGGKNFTQLMPAYGTSRGVHPDHHAWWIHPENPKFMMDGNDGGVNITRDGGQSWFFVETIPVAQFYHIAVDNELPYNVYGGMQDNGSWVGPAYIWKHQGIRNSYWQEISFGDGFDVLPDPTDSRFGISTAQQGYASIYDRKTGYNEMIRPTAPNIKEELRFNWNVGINRDPNNPKTIYFGSQYVHKSTDGGQTWEIISPDLTTNDPNKQKQGESGGLTMDATGAENYCTIIVIEPSTLDSNIIWVGTDDGNVQLTTDGGKTWVNKVPTKSKEWKNGFWICQIKASNKNKAHAYLVANDYRRFDYKPYVFKTTDFGNTWTKIVKDTDIKSYALSIIEDPIESKLLFLGSDDGLYVSIDAGNNWNKYNNDFPTTNVMDMVIHPREHDLVIGTFGRAAYVLDDIRPFREIAKKGTSILNKRIKVYEPPTAYVVAVQQPTGSRFGADALYNAQNRPLDANIAYSIQLPPTEDKKTDKKEKDNEEDKNKPKFDSLTFQVFNLKNENIRTIKFKAPEKSGLHKFNWGLEEKGIHRMSREEEKKDNEPQGVTVLPGKYKIRFSFGDQKDSTEIEVMYDKRLELKDEDIKLQYDELKKLENQGLVATEIINQINKSLTIASDFEKKINEHDKEKYKEELKKITKTKDTLNYMLDLFFGKKDERQGITKDQIFNISSYYSDAYYYTSNALHAPTKNEKDLIEKFNSELKKTIVIINNYYENEWPQFKESMNKIEIEVFPEVKKF